MNNYTVRKTFYLVVETKLKNCNIMGIEAGERDNYVGSFLLLIHKSNGTDFDPKRIIFFLDGNR